MRNKEEKRGYISMMLGSIASLVVSVFLRRMEVNGFIVVFGMILAFALISYLVNTLMERSDNNRMTNAEIRSQTVYTS